MTHPRLTERRLVFINSQPGARVRHRKPSHRDAELRTPANSTLVDSLIAAARRRAISQLGLRTDLVALRDTWTDLSQTLERMLGPDARQIVRPAHAPAHDGRQR
jgi:hypothetical protein